MSLLLILCISIVIGVLCFGEESMIDSIKKLFKFSLLVWIAGLFVFIFGGAFLALIL